MHVLMGSQTNCGQHGESIAFIVTRVKLQRLHFLQSCLDLGFIQTFSPGCNHMCELFPGLVHYRIDFKDSVPVIRKADINRLASRTPRNPGDLEFSEKQVVNDFPSRSLINPD